VKIGLEMHFQLPTRSKLFCSCPTTSAEPNTSVCEICLGFPGSRPYLNRQAMEMGLIIAKYFHCKVPERTWFSRKTYFYPDLPKNFQITQYEAPIGSDGEYFIDGRRISIWRVHIEEDPGRIKRVGRSGEEISLIDYDRSGVPLVEIVTGPELTSPEEARKMVDELLLELRHLVGVEASDEQVVRCDCNISIGEERVEVKNVQGLRNMERALKAEAQRQEKMLAAGKIIVRETRRYDEERKITMPAREKEAEDDYGYIGEPDLGEFHAAAMAAKLSVKETPLSRAQRISAHTGLDIGKSKQIVVTSWTLSDLFERLYAEIGLEKASQWTLGVLSSQWNALEEKKAHEEVVKILKLDAEGRITDAEARRRISTLAGQEVEHVAEGEAQHDLDVLVKKYLDEHPEVIRDYRTNPRSANAAIGFIMKEGKGRFHSKEVAETVKREIEGRL
jgi:aspartyl-tRNA(Asn)/glutamyl-tRNA(Gln) amidotransferase subunit B